MLKPIKSNNSPGHTHNGLTSVVGLSTNLCPGNNLLKSNKMNKIQSLENQDDILVKKIDKLEISLMTNAINENKAQKIQDKIDNLEEKRFAIQNKIEKIAITL